MTRRAPLRTVLVANRGEIARRIFRSCRARGLSTVAVFSDADAGLPFVAEADRAARIGAPAPSASYLSIPAILDAARKTGADAIHPGYGFLSESAAFARAVRDAGLTWIGPPPEAIEALGDKARAKALAIAHDVPTAQGFWGPVEQIPAKAAEIGYPVLLKAVAGGGGRGMRRVDRPEELAEAIGSAAREAQGAFGSAELLVERYVERARHVEVQLLADAHGSAVHLFERECSIQRRHQKIVEEAPSPGIDGELREKLGSAAVRLAKAAGYVNAGTAEFLVEPDGRFSFLEMNTRLQVEHPVTEEITGLDLVDLQLRIADGAPLPFAQDDLEIRGHAIEVRLYAEDPLRDHLPASGRLLALDLPPGEGIRIEAGYVAGDEVSPHYDPMIAKLIAWGPDRATATARLRRHVERAWAPGIATNLPLLRQILAHDAWEAGDLDTAFLGRTGLPVAPPANVARGALAGTVLGWLARRTPEAPSGFRIGGPTWQSDRWTSPFAEGAVGVRWRTVEGRLEVAVGSEDPRTVIVHGFAANVLDLEVDGLRERWRVHGEAVDGGLLYVHHGDGESCVRLEDRFPPPRSASEAGSCSAPTPGTVTKVHVAVGDRVTRGQPLVAIEAMKMEHAATAPYDGIVGAVAVAVGDAVREGALLVRVDPEEEA